MNRKQRRKAKVGEVIQTKTFAVAGPDGEPAFFWVETKERHGPFESQEEAHEDQRVALFGAQCKVTHGGAWDPQWDEPQ